MIPKWFNDTIPLDPLIAPMVLFFQNNGIITTQSCEGGDRKDDHLSGCPTIWFKANNIKDIDIVDGLLRDNNLDCSAEVGLMTGFFCLG